MVEIRNLVECMDCYFVILYKYGADLFFILLHLTYI